MKAMMFGSLTIAIAATMITSLGGASSPTTSTPQFEETDLANRSYIYRGTGRRQILS